MSVAVERPAVENMETAEEVQAGPFPIEALQVAFFSLFLLLFPRNTSFCINFLFNACYKPIGAPATATLCFDALTTEFTHCLRRRWA